MKLILLRHAHALPGEIDGLRPLSAKGRRQVRGLPKALVSEAFAGVRVLEHSGLVRSVETAGLLKKYFKVRLSVKVLKGIEPEGSARLTAQLLARSSRPRFIVGHNPHLSILAALLLGLKAGAEGIKFRKAGILALERLTLPSKKYRFGRWRLLWLLLPPNDTANS